MEENYKSTLKARKLVENLWTEELDLFEERIKNLRESIFTVQLHYSITIICLHGMIRPKENGFEYLFMVAFSLISAPTFIGWLLKARLKNIKKRIEDFWFFIEKSDIVIGRMEFYSKNVIESIEKEIMYMYPERSILKVRREKIFQFCVHIFFLLIIGIFFVKNNINTKNQLMLNFYMIQYLIYAGIFSSTFLTFRNFNRI